jgi:hypothetical protein
MKRAVPVLAMVLALTAMAPTAAGSSGQLTIDVQAAIASRDQERFRTAGTFTMSGLLADGGTAITAYRVAGTRVDATATLIGARGILTLGMRGALGGIVDDRQRAAGRWAVCGGTGPYRRLAGRGQWQSVADIGAAPAGMMPPTVRGAFLGRVSRSSTRTPDGVPHRNDARC